MKRSTMVALALVAGAGGAAYWAFQSSEEMEISMAENATLVSSVDECVAATSFSRSECEEAAQRALAEANAEVKPLPSKAACEEKFGVGQCEMQQASADASAGSEAARSSGTGMWLPLMTGFLIRDALVRAGNNGARGFVSQPAFGGNTATAGAGATGGARSFTTSDGSRFQTNARGVAPVPSATATNALSRQTSAITSRAAPVMRSGFGSSGRSATS